MAGSIQKQFFEILSSLPERHADILKKRYGFYDGKRHTLESIGKHYGITRERVRQIENDAKKSLLKKNADFFDKWLKEVKEYLDYLGGVRAEKDILSDAYDFFQKNLNYKDAQIIIFFLLSLHPNLERIPENNEMHTIWTDSKTKALLVKKSLEALSRKLKRHSSIIEKDELLKWFSEIMPEISEKRVLESYLSTSKEIISNIFGDYGLRSWPEISTKGVKDKAYLILKKHGRPLHFREVVDKINTHFKHHKTAHPQTVHNELIKGDEFVLVGRGTYALSEWGYRPGTVSEVIKRVLEKSKRPLTKEEIVNAVLKERNVKPTTVVLNLQNNPVFERMKDGRYTLRLSA